MKAVFGLGNPGLKYVLTRHNVGFQVIGLYRKINQTRSRALRTCLSLVYRTEDLLLVKPMTHMNASGDGVKAVLERFQIDYADALIVYDDLDLPLGKMRILPKGGPGTHKGMTSIVARLASEEIPRIRIGIGGLSWPPDTIDYVLGRFTPDEWKQLLPTLRQAVEAIDTFRLSDINTVMNRFN